MLQYLFPLKLHNNSYPLLDCLTLYPVTNNRILTKKHLLPQKCIFQELQQ